MRYLLFILSILLILLATACKTDNPTGYHKIISDEEKPIYPLLTDEELITPIDPDSQAVDLKWSTWIREHNLPIRSLHSEDFSDLNDLKNLLENKKIVQLGESTHGAKQFCSSKVRLIKYLHEVLGYNVIAFESSIFECFYANQNINSYTSSKLMSNSIYSIWHNNEVRKLFDYIKLTHTTTNPLFLAGFDIQVSSYNEVQNRPIFIKEVISKIDPVYANKVYEIDSLFAVRKNRLDVDYVRSNYDSLIHTYEKVLNFIDNNAIEFQNIYNDNTNTLLIARQTVYSIIQLIQRIYHYYNSDKVTAIRDKGMADNLIFLSEKIYPSEKIIVWAHNAHIRKNNENTIGYYGEKKTMGGWLSDYFKTDMYTIGLYMYRGSAAHNNRETYNIKPPLNKSLESILYTARRKACFIDFYQYSENYSNSWIFNNIKTYSWGLFPVSMVLNEQYDGILFIDTVSPPNYL